MGPPEAEKAASSPDEAAFQKVEQISLPLNQTNRTDAEELQVRSLRRRFALGYYFAATVAQLAWGALPR